MKVLKLLFLTYLIKEYPQQGVSKHVWIKSFYTMVFCFAYAFYGEKIVMYADRKGDDKFNIEEDIGNCACIDTLHFQLSFKSSVLFVHL